MDTLRGAACLLHILVLDADGKAIRGDDGQVVRFLNDAGGYDPADFFERMLVNRGDSAGSRPLGV